MKKRVFLGDPSLLNYSGHCYHYLKSLERPFLEKGFSPIYISNRGIAGELQKTISAMPIITYWCDAQEMGHGLGRETSYFQVRDVHEKTIYNDMQELHSKVALNNNDILLINTFRQWPLRGFFKFLEGLGEEKCPNVVLVFHFTAYPNPEKILSATISKMYEAAFRYLEKSFLKDKILLLADSKDLIDEYQSISHLNFHLAPIPHTTSDSVLAKKIKNKSELVISYLGEARLNKGFHLLPYAVNSILQSDLGKNVRFKIHSFINNPNEDFYKTTMGNFSKQSLRLEFVNEQLSEEEYHEFLIASDVLLIPYTLENYYRQTSGILSEAMAYGVPSIVPRGSWMSHQVKTYGGGASFIPEDSQDLADVLRSVIIDYDKYKDSAIRAAKSWTAFNNASRFTDLVLQNIL